MHKAQSAALAIGASLDKVVPGPWVTRALQHSQAYSMGDGRRTMAHTGPHTTGPRQYDVVHTH